MKITDRPLKEFSRDRNKAALGRIKFLDGLRGIAIILVILGHAKSTMNLSHSFLENTSFFWGNSGLGVRIFFVMSGYLITLILKKEISGNKAINFRWFYIKRIIRLFPSFYAFLLAIFIVNRISSLDIAPHEFWSAITFTWNYASLWFPDGTIEGRWFLGHMWSLALEEQFYLIWPFLFVFVSRKKLINGTASFIIISPLIRILSYFIFPEQRGILGMMFHTAIDAVLVGCLLALVSDLAISKWIFNKINSSLCLFCLIFIPAFASPCLENFIINGYDISIGRTIDAICIGLLICWLHRSHSTAVNRLFSNPLLMYIGRMSYSLYLWQQLFLTNLNVTISGIFPVNIVFCFLAALVSFYIIETPFMNLKRSSLIQKMAGVY